MNYQEKYDAIFELAGSLSFNIAKFFLKPKGIYISTLPTPIDMFKAAINNLSASKRNIIIQATPSQEILKEINDWLPKNSVEIPVAKSFSIDAYKEAYHFAKKGGFIGKVVFTIL